MSLSELEILDEALRGLGFEEVDRVTWGEEEDKDIVYEKPSAEGRIIVTVTVKEPIEV